MRTNKPGNDLVGVTGILGFDPGGRQCRQTRLAGWSMPRIEAILKWIDRKVDEAPQAAHLSSVYAQEPSSEARNCKAKKPSSECPSEIFQPDGEDLFQLGYNY